MYNNDIIKVAVPAIVPIVFKEVIPLEATHKNNRNIANIIVWAIIVLIPLTKVPSPLTAHPNAINIACGFWAKYGICTTQ